MSLIKSVIDWCNSNDGFAMIALTSVYAITTIGMFRSSNKMLKLGMQQKEQERIIASLGLIRDIDDICKNPPIDKTDSYSKMDRLSILKGQINTLGGVKASIAYKKLYDFLNTLCKSNNDNIFDDKNTIEEFSKKHRNLEHFFCSESVSEQELVLKLPAIKKDLWNKLLKGQGIIEFPILRKAFNSSWGADTSENGILGFPKSKGQSVVTAMVVQDFFKGDIYKIKLGSEWHYFNVKNSDIIDLTSDQFLKKVDYSEKQIVSRKEFEQEIINRYEILKPRFETVLLDIMLKK